MWKVLSESPVFVAVSVSEGLNSVESGLALDGAEDILIVSEGLNSVERFPQL